jgi:glycine betaine transporter
MLRTIAYLLIAAFVGWALAAPSHFGAAANAALAFSTQKFSWFYLWAVFAMVVASLVLAFGRYGSIRLGDDDEEPAFSRMSWFSMLFAAGMGIGLVFWGVAEPLSHYVTPPPGIAPKTPEAANAAMRYAFFHWGIHPWAVYSVVALAIAFFQFRRKLPITIGATMSGLPARMQGRWVHAVDLLAVLATAFGVATSLGLGALQINSGLARVFGLPVGVASQVGIIVVTTAIFLASSASGLDRGIKWLSNTNLVLAGMLALFVLLIGPTSAILETFTTTLGRYLSEFVQMSLRLTPFRAESTWVGGWTVFYWAWWISWSPFVGLFIARVSRGRTIREFVIGTMLVPSLAGFAWFSVFGGTALHMEIFEGVPLSEAAARDAAIALFALFDTLPASLLLSVVATVLVLVFFVTSGDSATFVLGMLSDRGNPDPSLGNKLSWGILVALIAIALLVGGGLKALQTAAIVMALPFAVVILLMLASLLRALRDEADRLEREERAMRRRMRDQARSDAAKNV